MNARVQSSVFERLRAIILIMRKFNKIFKDLVEQSGLSNVKIAKELGVSHTTINRWKNGLSDILSDDLIKVAKFFGVPTDYLLGLID